ncbi:hypothetical protein M409DRAFT_18755 [Zasmidium cellare ATCC 36951]|uniref:Uncharacterized protein n=1 Tax=Zasmidium cellare ATCC 36951 TaxID=1080233 RepID=A0A6A6CUK8_ZASCE|nr:uncharacterized protein M409DRAFT_18755 [Zasmidium cellare ATCC 36951]KAF2170781.1 hypothetical protein M409DRAFT_18755 [Zasmidium cellare ATCC 36951]
MSVSSEDCHFWRLPLEVRFLVYNLVYGPGKTISLSLSSFMMELDSRAKPRVVLRRDKSSPSAVERRLVNSQYLSETMQHLAEHSKFRLWRDFHRFCLLSPGFLEHIRLLQLDWNEYDSPAKLDLSNICPRLRQLQIIVDSRGLSLWNLLDRPCKNMIRRMPLVVALSGTCGLQEFGLHDEAEYVNRYGFVSSVIDDERRLRVAMLEEVIRQVVTRPKGGQEEPA